MSKPENGDFESFKGDIEAAERRVAREIDPGARALVIAIGVFVLLLSFVLPHTGGAKGIDVLTGGEVAARSTGNRLYHRSLPNIQARVLADTFLFVNFING